MEESIKSSVKGFLETLSGKNMKFMKSAETLQKYASEYFGEYSVRGGRLPMRMLGFMKNSTEDDCVSNTYYIDIGDANIAARLQFDFRYIPQLVMYHIIDQDRGPFAHMYGRPVPFKALTLT